MDYLLAKKIDFPDKYYGHIGLVGAVYDLQGILQRSGGINPLRINNITKSSTMGVINQAIYTKNLKNLKEKSIGEYHIIVDLLSFKDDKYVNKICDFGNIFIIKGVR